MSVIVMVSMVLSVAYVVVSSVVVFVSYMYVMVSADYLPKER